MKAIKLVFVLAVLLVTAMTVNAEKKGEKTVVFKANLHCESCKAKIEKNLPYEKGVKGLEVDMETQTITVTFREDKNNEENLKKAIEKLKIAVEGTIDPKDKKAAAVHHQCNDKHCGEKH